MLLTGQLPYDKPEAEEIMGDIERGILPRFPDDLMVSDERMERLMYLCFRCWVKDPAKRPDMKEILRKLALPKSFMTLSCSTV